MPYKVVSRSGLLKVKEEDCAKMDAQLVEALLSDEDDIIKNAHDADAVIVGAIEHYTRRVIEALKKCKIISRMGIGWDNIDLTAATEHGIPVAYVPDASVAEVSDHAMALLLCFLRRLIPISQAAREGSWQASRTDIPALRKTIPRLSEQTLGLIGLGKIGSAVCNKAKVFGMRILFLILSL